MLTLAQAFLALLSVLPSSRSLAATHLEYRAFVDPYLDLLSHDDQTPNLKYRFPRDLQRRQCSSDYSQCSSQGNPNLCCPPETTCTLDSANNIACCTNGEICTGTLGVTLPGSVASTTTSGGVTTTGPVTITSYAGGGTAVSNPYYPFIAIPTSFSDAAQCSTSVSFCSSQSTACFNSLAGANGVTVAGGGGGITQTAELAAAASSICSSLSTAACSNIQDDTCSVFGNGANNAGPRQTACPGMMYAGAVGAAAVGIGIW